MFDNIIKFFKKFSKDEKKDSKDTAKERLHLVLMQDRANVSADFMELMKQEIIEVIKKYINVDENSIDVKLTNKVNSDGTTGAPMLYANIPILNVKDDTKQINIERKLEKDVSKQADVKEGKEQEVKEVQEENANEGVEVEKVEQKEQKSAENKDAEENKEENKTKKAESNEKVKKDEPKTKTQGATQKQEGKVAGNKNRKKNKKQ